MDAGRNRMAVIRADGGRAAAKNGQEKDRTE
jgi:hypothetical protein